MGDLKNLYKNNKQEYFINKKIVKEIEAAEEQTLCQNPETGEAEEVNIYCIKETFVHNALTNINVLKIEKAEIENRLAEVNALIAKIEELETQIID